MDAKLPTSSVVTILLHCGVSLVCATYLTGSSSSLSAGTESTNGRRYDSEVMKSPMNGDGLNRYKSNSLSGWQWPASSSAYGTYKLHAPSTEVVKKQSSTAFSNDQDILRYLKTHGQQMMIWRCRNAIKPQYSRQPTSSHIDLYCEVIGTIKSVAWLHNGKSILVHDNQTSKHSGRYRHRISPHIDYNQNKHATVLRHRSRQARHKQGQGKGHSRRLRHVYSRWVDFRLRIHRVTSLDSGSYVFRATSPDGRVAEQLIHVDLSDYVNRRQRYRL